MRAELLTANTTSPPMGAAFAQELAERFARVAKVKLPGVEIDWEFQSDMAKLMGTARLSERVQPFTLLLQSMAELPMVRCISPVGRVNTGQNLAAIVDRTASTPAVRIGTIMTEDERTYDLTVEGDCLLGLSPEADSVRVAMLVGRVVKQADLLEQQFLPGRDQEIEAFRKDLIREGNDGR